MVQPVFPADGKEINATRLFRNVQYEIHFQRIGAGNSVEINVDGKKIESTIIPLPSEGTTSLKVEVLVGERK